MSEMGLGCVETPRREQWTHCLSAMEAMFEFSDFSGLEVSIGVGSGPRIGIQKGPL
jgi:hypothetical protein